LLFNKSADHLKSLLTLNEVKGRSPVAHLDLKQERTRGANPPFLSKRADHLYEKAFREIEGIIYFWL